MLLNDYWLLKNLVFFPFSVWFEAVFLLFFSNLNTLLMFDKLFVDIWKEIWLFQIKDWLSLDLSLCLLYLLELALLVWPAPIILSLAHHVLSFFLGDMDQLLLLRQLLAFNDWFLSSFVKILIFLRALSLVLEFILFYFVFIFVFLFLLGLFTLFFPVLVLALFAFCLRFLTDELDDGESKRDISWIY